MTSVASAETPASPPGKWTLAALVTGIAVVYFAAAKVGLSMAVVDVAEQVTLVWPPTGIALAAVLLLGPRIWPGILAGAFVANVTANEPVPTALGIALGNTAEALAGAWLLRRGGFDSSLSRVRDVARLLILAAVLATTISATVGATSLCAGGVQPWSRFPLIWRDWWLGDAIGAIVFAPFILTWRTAARARPEFRTLVEAGALVAGLVTFSQYVFGGFGPTPEAMKYLIFPFVIWAAVRFGPRGAAAVSLVVATVAMRAVLNGLVPFSVADPHVGLVLLQLFLGVTSMTGLFLGAVALERNEAERAMRRDKERKDEFIATLAHELRGPLAPLSNALALLRTSGDTPTRTRSIDTAERQLRHMVRLVDDLFDLARVTRGEIPLRRRRVDLANVVERAVETVRPVLAERSQEFVVRAPAEPVPLDVDPTRIAQVLSNLLNNASKFSPPGSVIRLSASVAPADGDGAGEVVVSVKDEGIGIAGEFVPHIFEPFMQADRSIDRTQGGLGIGLTLVRRLVGAHGGTVECRSEGLGKGAEFVVRLPVATGPADRQPISDSGALPSVAAEPARPRVLVVDDDRDSATTMAMLLRKRGYEVATAHEGPRAVELAAEFRPDAALLDIGLPLLNGYEVARRIRALPTGNSITLIAVTGWGQSADRRNSREAGFDHHLVKPVDPAVLGRLLEDIRAPAPRAPAEPAPARDVEDLARASHDLRTPLSTMTVAAQLLLESDLDPSQRELAERMRSGAQRLASLLDGLLGVTGPPPDAPARPAVPIPLRVLVVDDDGFARSLSRRMLESLGCTVEEAEGGPDAIEAVARAAHDVVVVDLRMPGMDGAETVREMRGIAPGDGRPYVIAATASTLRDDHRALIAAGADVCLVKPLTAQALRSALECAADAAAAPPASTVTTNALDGEVLDGLRPVNGRDGRPVLGRLIALFLDDTPQILARLRDAAARRDGAEIEAAAHVLRGNAASVGARQLSALAAQAEEAAQAGDAAAAADVIGRIEDAWPRTQAALESERCG